ncbi:MAG: DUF3109 family protein [Mucinivorans sp.]
MVEIEDKIVSSELFTAQFCCDIKECHGECCVQGDAGAPLEQSEVTELEEQWPQYSPYMTTEGVEATKNQGLAVIDEDNELTTPLVHGAQCAYAINQDGATWCAIEKAYIEGKCSFRKPISCHLYPIREVKLKGGKTGLQYHRWSVCQAAELLGKAKGEPLYRTLREPLIRRFGEDFYHLLEQVDKECFEL